MKLVMPRCTLLGCLLLGCLGCSGAASDPSDDGSSGDEDGPIAPEGAACALPEDLLPPARVMRLSPAQYLNTMKQNFGYEVDPVALPPDAPSGEGFAVFDTNHSDKQVTSEHFNTFRNTAEAVATGLVAALEQNDACVVQTPDDACVEQFLQEQGEKAFRRPLSNEELNRYLEFFRTSEKRWDVRVAVRMTLEALLQSPWNLYRTELGAGEGGKLALTSFELANQLSFMIADAPPDEELLGAARDGKLKDPAEVKRHAERLVRSDAGRDKLSHFVTQMFQVDPLSAGSLSKDTAVFSEFTPELWQSMLEESRTFVHKVLQEDASLRTLYTANFSFANQELAKLYGVVAPAEDGFARVELPQRRRGLLGHASVLAVTSHASHTSVAERGLAVFTRLLCQPIPSAPPGAADLAKGKVFAPNDDFTQREHYDFAQKNAPECMGCHGQFVPFGLGLEQFDAIGRQRDSEFGKPIDTTVRLVDFDDELNGEYPSTLEAADAIVQSSLGARCFATQLSSFALGRDVDSATMESCETKQLAKALVDSDFSVTQALINLTQVQSFYNRRQGS